MTKIKFCGLTRTGDIEAANELKPDYIGFVFWSKSKRAVTAGEAKILKSKLDPSIKAVGVFVDEDIEVVKSLLNDDIIDIAQLHGSEDGTYINDLKTSTGKPVIKAFKIRSEDDGRQAEESPADMVLLDSGMGTGKTFNWEIIKGVKRPFFLAGGLDPDNAADAVRTLHPYALDVSSGIETDGLKDINKMAAFAASVRKEDIT
ncbi:MAG: phosphoribosylanthranilate isomerase [Clostridiales bacterium]|nr:phosphoribosylanthranilate isomerase [Clostridiales bacterium]MBP3810057.1 phosphoribosylanthranilate isomerase [Clostridiales bacterium]